MDELQHLQQRNQELAILNTIAQDLNREVSLQKALDATLVQTVKLLNLETGWIWLFDSETQESSLAAEYQLPPVFKEQPALLQGTCYCIEKYFNDKLDTAANISEITCTRLKNLYEGTEGLRYHASVPLHAPDRKIGILNVVSPHLQELSAERLQLLYTIGDMLSIAIERARLFEKSRRLGIAEERNRLAREIHDTLAQGLTAISLKLETAEALWESETKREQVATLLHQSLELTQVNIEEARRSVLDLRARPLQENTLVEALAQLLDSSGTKELPTQTFEVRGKEQGLSVKIQMGLYRIAQEALQNAFQHAHAAEICLTINFGAKSVSLVIEDNGIGFNYESVDTEGMGLLGMNERAKLLNGKLELHTSPGTGTRIEVHIPYS